MNAKEVAECIAFINSSWGNKPLDKVAARTWGAELLPYPRGAVIAVLRDMLRSQEWRPSLAQIIRGLRGDEVSATEAFARVCAQIPKRPHDVTELEAEAVRRLGGWSRLGQWELDRRSFHFRGFKEVWDDLLDSRGKEQARAIADGKGNVAALKDGAA